MTNKSIDFYNVIGNYPFFFPLFIMFVGIFIILYSDNLIKKVFGLNIFQTSVITFYISISRIQGGHVPIVNSESSAIIYTNPLPHVLMLTAIVVGIALTAVAFALIIKVKQNYHTVSEKLININNIQQPPQ